MIISDAHTPMLGNDFIFELDEKYTFVKVIAVDENELLSPVRQFVGKSIYQVFPDEIAQRYAHAFRQARQSGTSQSLAYTAEIEGNRVKFSARVKSVSRRKNSIT